MIRLILFISLFIAFNATAGDTQVITHGASNIEAGFIKQKPSYKQMLLFSPNQTSYGFLSQAKVSLQAENVTDNGLTYGTVLRLQTATLDNNGYVTPRNDRSHIYIDTNIGSFQAGSNYTASKLLKIDPGRYASASGGADGNWGYYVNSFVTTSEGSIEDAVMVSGDTILNDTKFDWDTEGARKITYLSPRFSNLQLGFSYIPDSANMGTGNISQTEYFYQNAAAKKIWAFAANYSKKFDLVEVALSLAYEKGTAVNKNLNNIRSGLIGGSINYNDVTLAGSYGSDSNSLIVKNLGSYSNNWWTAGIAYQAGLASASLTYLSGKSGPTKLSKKLQPTVITNVIALGLDYEILSGFRPYAEVVLVNIKPQNYNESVTTSGVNRATVLLLGTSMSF